MHMDISYETQIRDKKYFKVFLLNLFMFNSMHMLKPLEWTMVLNFYI